MQLKIKFLVLLIWLKKTDYNAKVSEIKKKLTDHKHDRYITTPEFNKLTAENFAERLKQANLVTKTDLDNKLTSLNRKIVLNKTKHLAIEKELKKLNTFDLSYFRGKNYFEEDGTQNWFVFQSMGKYLKITYTNNIIYVLSWQSKGLSDLEISSIKTNNYLLNPRIDQYDTSKVRLKFNGSILNRSPPSIIHGKIVNIYVVYEITSNYNDSNYPTVSFSIGNDTGRNVIIFGINMSSSLLIGNKKRHFNSW